MALSLGEMKRRHHYVWQHYLRAWTEGGQIPCWRAGAGLFKTSTANVAVIKDFYRLKELTPEDIRFVEMVCISKAPDPIKPLLRGWIPLFTNLFEMRRAFEAAGLNVSEGAGAEQFEVAINNLEEDLHGEIEAGAVEYLDALRAADLRFLNSDDDFSTFLHFLIVQFFRTRRQRERVFSRLRDFIGVNVENAWGLMSHILATTLAYSLDARKETIRSTLLQAPHGEGFVTTDQPVINLDAVDVAEGVEPHALTLYYPVSPEAALLMEIGKGRESVLRPITAAEVREYNRKMLSQMHEQAFGREEDLLAQGLR